jgi:hypothetical protein
VWCRRLTSSTRQAAGCVLQPIMLARAQQQRRTPRLTSTCRWVGKFVNDFYLQS